MAVDALSPPPPPPPPSSAFSFGKLKKNKRKGTAKLTVEIVEGPGELELAKTRKVKADEETIADATDVCTSSKGGASINTWSVLALTSAFSTSRALLVQVPVMEDVAHEAGV